MDIDKRLVVTKWLVVLGFSFLFSTYFCSIKAQVLRDGRLVFNGYQLCCWSPSPTAIWEKKSSYFSWLSKAKNSFSFPGSNKVHYLNWDVFYLASQGEQSYKYVKYGGLWPTRSWQISNWKTSLKALKAISSVITLSLETSKMRTFVRFNNASTLGSGKLWGNFIKGLSLWKVTIGSTIIYETRDVSEPVFRMQ